MRLNEIIGASSGRRQGLGILFASVLLIGFIGFLLASNYRSQRELQKSSLKSFRLDLEKRAASLDYFLSERKYDLRNLAASREIAVYYKNKALGMTEQYGLKVNLFLAGKLLDRTLMEKTVQADPIYDRFVLLGDDSTLLSDSYPSEKFVPFELPFDWPLSEQGEPAVMVHPAGSGKRIALTIPCGQEDRQEGRLVAWLNMETLSRHFVESAPDIENKGFGLTSLEEIVVAPRHLSNCPLFFAETRTPVDSIPQNDFLRVAPPSECRQKEAVSLTRISTHNAPLYMLGWTREESYLNNPVLWQFLMGTGSLAFVIVLGTILLMRFNAQNIALKKQYAESERQQRLLALKNAQLEEEIRKRHELEKQLEEQRSLQMRSDRLRSLGEMAAGIAHELNQPLVGVRGMAELVLAYMETGRSMPEEVLMKNIGRIVEQADRMVHIINHVRMFAREAGNAETSVVDINKVALSSKDLISAQFKSHGLLLELDLHPAPLETVANPYSLEEVLLNLLANARHAVEKKQEQEKDEGFTPRVAIRTRPAQGDGSNIVRIAIEDNGTGIDSSIAEKIFDPFYTTKDPDKGTGLGLSICKSIVEGFGGTIFFENGLESGTVFVIEFPEFHAKEERAKDDFED